MLLYQDARHLQQPVLSRGQIRELLSPLESGPPRGEGPSRAHLPRDPVPQWQELQMPPVPELVPVLLRGVPPEWVPWMEISLLSGVNVGWGS